MLTGKATPSGMGLSVEEHGPDLLVELLSQGVQYQDFLREVSKNSGEGESKKFFVLPDLHTTGLDPKDKSIPLRLMLMDYGTGMDPLMYLQLGVTGAGKAQGVGKNHGLGGKLSLLPFNKAGLLVMVFGKYAREAGFPEGAGVFIQWFPDLNDGRGGFDAREFEFEAEIHGEMSTVNAPVFPVKEVFPQYLRDYRGKKRTTGTTIVLYGNDPEESTFLTHCPEAHTGAKWLNNRYFRPPTVRGASERLRILHWEFNRQRDKEEWPRTWPEALKGYTNAEGEVKRYGTTRWAKGLLAELRDAGGKTKKVLYEKVPLDEGLTGHYFMVKSQYAANKWWEKGLVPRTQTFGVVWQDEVYYSMQGQPVPLTHSGIFNTQVQKRCWVYVEVDEKYPEKVSANAERTHLLCGGGELPLRLWQETLAAGLPSFIRDALEESYQSDSADDATKDTLQGLLAEFAVFKPLLRRKSTNKDKDKRKSSEEPKKKGTLAPEGPEENPISRGRYAPPEAHWDDSEMVLPVAVANNKVTFYRKNRIINRFFEEWTHKYAHLEGRQAELVELMVVKGIAEVVLGAFLGAKQEQREPQWSGPAKKALDHLYVPLLNTPIVNHQIARHEHALLSKSLISKRPLPGISPKPPSDEPSVQ